MSEKTGKIRLGILFGGKSGEYEVSLLSAASVMAALDAREFEITAIGITRDGRLASPAETSAMLPASLHGRVLLYPPCLKEDPITARFEAQGHASPRPDILFPLLHGPNGEDGTIQGLLETLDAPYVGCGVLASAVGMDKDVMKRLFAHASLPIVPYRVERSRGLEARLDRLREEVEAQFGYPVFSKPANLGSSVGVRKIHHSREFNDAVLASARYDRKVILEKGIDARELECAVLGNEAPEASCVGEILSAREFYDYKAKYHNPASRVRIPADIDKETEACVRNLSLRAFQAIEGSGLARVDFFLDRKTGALWLNEINTMPGFTSISMYPKLWEASGVPFDQLIRRLIRFGFERHEDRAQTVRIFKETKGGEPL